MKRIVFIEQGFKIVTYNPNKGWVAYIYPNINGFYKPIVSIQGLKNKDDAYLKIGFELGILVLSEVDPNKKYEDNTKYINYEDILND